MRTAEQALVDNGLDGKRLLALSHHCATTVLRRSPYVAPGLEDQLASFLCEQALMAALRYDPARSGNGYSFPSFLWDVMHARVVDYWRRKAEGHGDRRYGFDNRIQLADDPLEEFAHIAVVDDLEPDGRQAAEEFAAEVGLSPEGTWTLVEVVTRLSEGAGVTVAAEEAGISTFRAKRQLADLRDELQGLGVVETLEHAL